MYCRNRINEGNLRGERRETERGIGKISVYILILDLEKFEGEKSDRFGNKKNFGSNLTSCFESVSLGK